MTKRKKAIEGEGQKGGKNDWTERMRRQKKTFQLVDGIQIRFEFGIITIIITFITMISKQRQDKKKWCCRPNQNTWLVKKKVKQL